MERLGDILRYSKPSRVMTAAMICQQAQEVIGDKGRVVSCQAGVLKIGVKDNYEAGAIAQDNINLVERINKRLGQNLVKRFRFLIESQD